MRYFYATVTVSASSATLPWWKKLIFAMVAMLLFFTLLEAIFWMAGVRRLAAGDDPYVGFAANLPLFVEQTDSQGRVWMTTAPNKLAWFNQQQFPREKARNTRRVFCLGGSTTYGHPYDDTTSFAAWLRELLPSASDDTQWEVINAGGISYASYRVAALMQELIQYQPDLFIVYTGNNEFLEERTYGDLRRRPARLLQTVALLGRSHTYSAVQQMVTRAQRRPQDRAVLPAEVDAVLDHTVGPASYRRDDRLHDQILAHFEINLVRMAELARGCEAEMVLVVPAVNLKDCSPFKSEHTEGLSDQQLQTWKTHVEQATERSRTGLVEEALTAYENALQIDPRHAEIHFRIAQLLLAAGRVGEASVAFQRAVDEDVCPLRTPSRFQQAVRRIALSLQIPLVDFDAVLKNESLLRYGHNIPGDEFFLDHVHLTIEGYRIVAIRVIESLAKQQILAVRFLGEEDITRATQQIESRIDHLHHAVAERNLAKVLNWAGKHQQAGRLALKSLQTLPDDPESLVIGAAYLRQQGDLQQAIEHLRRAVAQMPQYAEARQLLGAMLIDADQLDQALDQFIALARLRPDDAAAWQMVGAILVEQGKFVESLRYYQRALALAAGDANLHYNVGFALSQLGRHEQAKDYLQRAIELDPTDTVARELLTELNRL